MPVDARVDYRDDDRRATGRGRPRLRSVDVGVRSARGRLHRLPRVVQSPELPEERVVRERVDAVEDVRLRVANAGVAPELRENAAALGGRHRGDEGAKRSQAGIGRRVGTRENRSLGGHLHSAVEADEDPRAGLTGMLSRGCGRREEDPRQERQKSRRRKAGSRPHRPSLGACAGRYKAPTGGLSVWRPAGVVVPERRQKQARRAHAGDAEDRRPRRPRRARSEERRDDARIRGSRGEARSSS